MTARQAIVPLGLGMAFAGALGGNFVVMVVGFLIFMIGFEL